MGPGDGIQKQRLLDLPTTIETADQTNQHRVSLKSFWSNSLRFHNLYLKF